QPRPAHHPRHGRELREPRGALPAAPLRRHPPRRREGQGHAEEPPPPVAPAGPHRNHGRRSRKAAHLRRDRAQSRPNEMRDAVAPLHLQQVTAVLEQTPATLEGLLGGLPESLLEANEGPDTYSPRDVLGHLVFGEETDWVPRIRIILEHGESLPFTPFDRTGFRAYGEQRVEPLLRRFRELREEGLAYVRSLDLQPEHMDRRGTHPGLGTVTLRQLLASWAVHDLGHLAQVSRVIAKQFRSDVGP